MVTGIIKRFNETKGFGFIAPDNAIIEVFVHIPGVANQRCSALTEDQKVTYEIRNGAEGPQAINVHA